MKKNILVSISVLFLLGIASCTNSDPNYGPSAVISTWQKNYLTDTLYLSFIDNSNYTYGLVHSGFKTQTVKGTYNYTDKEITIYDVSGTGAHCLGMPGVYNYFVYADTLILSTSSDNCIETGSQRSAAISGSWIRH